MSRFEELGQLLIEGMASPAEQTELEQLLEQDEQLQERLFRDLEVESTLRNLNTSFDVSDDVMVRLGLGRARLAGHDRAGRRAWGWRRMLAQLRRHHVLVGVGSAAVLAMAASFVFWNKSEIATLTIDHGVLDNATADQQSVHGSAVKLYGGDHVKLDEGASASIAYPNGAQLQLGLQAEMTVIPGDQPTEIAGTHLRLDSGKLYVNAPQAGGRPFTIETPQSVATVTSAVMEMIATVQTTQLRVDSGQVRIARRLDGKSLDVEQGQYVLVRDDLELAAAPVPTLRCLFDDQINPAAFWTIGDGVHAIVHQDSRAGLACLRITPQQGHVTFSGLGLAVREHPRSGEYRFITFAWRKDGNGRLGLKLDEADEAYDKHKQGRRFGYRFDAGEGPAVDGFAMRLAGKAPQAWSIVNRDLWQEFGDFTVTGLTFACPDGDAAWFDRIYLGQSPGDFEHIARTAVPAIFLAQIRNDRPVPAFCMPGDSVFVDFLNHTNLRTP